MDHSFRGGIDLPWGPYGERYTDYEDSFTFLTVKVDNAEIEETTDDGWPTVVVGERAETPVGVAIGHVTQLNDRPAEEIDIFVDVDKNWWALVEFADLDAAISNGRYGIRGYDGYEVLPCERRTEGFDLFNAYADDSVTPIFEMDDDAAAFAIQRASNYSVLQRMFSLDTYAGIEDRRKRLERRVLPRDEWLDKNSLTDIARDLPDEEQRK